MAGEFKSGQRIPTEEQLVDEFSVSRTTVRRATLELQHEGLIVIRRSAGTFVTEHGDELVLDPGDRAVCDGMVTVVRADGDTEIWRAGTRISSGV